MIFTPATDELREPTNATSGILRAPALPRIASKRRHVVDHLQSARIMRLAECDQCHTEVGASLEFALGLFAGANLRGAGAAAARQIR